MRCLGMWGLGGHCSAGTEVGQLQRQKSSSEALCPSNPATHSFIQPLIYHSHLTIVLFQKATIHAIQYTHPVGLQISEFIPMSVFWFTYSAFQSNTNSGILSSIHPVLSFINQFLLPHPCVSGSHLTLTHSFPIQLLFASVN